MRVPFPRSGPRRPTAIELEAAELVLSGDGSGRVQGAAGTESAELSAQRAVMQSIVATLEHIPPQAWNMELRPAQATARDGAALRRNAAAERFTRGWRLRRAPALAGGLSAVALAAAFALGSLTHPLISDHHLRLTPAGVPRVVLRPLPGTPMRNLAVAYMPGGNRMLLTVRSLTRSAPGTYYELWLMTSDTDLLPVTSFRVTTGNSGTLRLELPDTASHYRFLDISVQRLGGGSAISGDSVLRGVIPS